MKRINRSANSPALPWQSRGSRPYKIDLPTKTTPTRPMKLKTQMARVRHGLPMLAAFALAQVTSAV